MISRIRFFPASLILLLLAFVLYGYLLPAYRGQAEQAVIAGQRAVMQTLAAAVAASFPLADAERLHDFLYVQQQLHPEWRFLALYGPGGRLFYPSQLDVEKPQRTLEQAIAFRDGMSGRLEVGVDIDRMVAQQTKALSQLTYGLLGGLVALALVAAWWQGYAAPRRPAKLELEVRRRQIEAINSAQSRFIAGGDPRKFFDGMLPDIMELTESEFGFIGEAMTNAEGAPYIKVYALTRVVCGEMKDESCDRHEFGALELHSPDSLLVKVIRTGEQVINNHPGSDLEFGCLAGADISLNAFLGVPVYLGKELLGMIGLANRPGGYDESVVDRLLPILNTCAQIFSAVIKERTQRHTALELKRSYGFMSALVENLQAGLLVEDEAGRIYTLNQTYCDMFGKDELPLMIEGEDCENEFERNQELFSRPGALLQWRRKCLEREKVVTGKEMTLRDGRVFEQDYVPVIFEDEQGQTHRSHLWSYRDISEHKRIENTLERAKEAAEAAATAKSQFLATMSHELRTPMNGVLGMLQLLRKTRLDARQKRFVETATGSGEMLLKVINDILDFSKLEAGKLDLESIPFDLEALLEQSVALLAKEAHEKQVELLYLSESGMPRWVKGDPTRLRQVLTNLINNAIKFTAQGEIVLYASSLRDGRIRFGVRDTGIGISAAQQKLLFQAFSQVDSSHTRKYGGTGLGLAISQKLISAMGGTIRVASTPGKGSDFSFELMLDILERYPSGQSIPEALSRLRFLVVDDNPTLRELLKRILESWRVAGIGLAEGGDDALTQLHAAAEAGQPYDIVLLDQNMPEMTGLELARSIRADATLADMKLIMISAVDSDRTVPELDAWLTKPVRQADLYKNLMRLSGERIEDENNTRDRDAAQELRFERRRLLLVEDNLVNQEVAREILGSAGFAIDIRENGAEAVRAVQEADYDVVLMDIQMPVMDGLEASRRIRALGNHYAELPIIAMTAHALSDDVDKSLAVGMNGHVTKPLDVGTLFAELARWVRPGTAPVDAATPTVVDTDKPLPALPGIDMADGLQRLNGNQATYGRILRLFRDKQADAATRLQQLIHRGEWHQAARLAHTLKGNAGNIGAKQLYEAAARMEQACRNSDAAAAGAAMGALQDCLAQVVDGLAALGALEQPRSVAGEQLSTDAAGVSLVLNQLMTSLDVDLGAAQDCLATLRQQLAGSDRVSLLDELEGALAGFDIEAARRIVMRMQRL